MSNKKSYMNRNNLLTEGFFDKLFKKLGIKDKDEQRKIKSDKKLNSAVKNLNKSQKEFEDWFNELRRERGEPPMKSKKWTVDDWI
tara:strand:+ start:178 stop:432 length:255 start_codon:yes stop_codon:yes gene_type:complete